jgi:hypothetical protein
MQGLSRGIDLNLASFELWKHKLAQCSYCLQGSSCLQNIIQSTIMKTTIRTASIPMTASMSRLNHNERHVANQIQSNYAARS